MSDGEATPASTEPSPPSTEPSPSSETAPASAPADPVARLRDLLGTNPPPPPEAPGEAPKIVTPEVKPATAPVVEKRTRAKIYDPQRRGYRRATREEGLGAEVQAMREEAAGSPFFDVADEKPSTDDVRARLGLTRKRKA